MNTSFVALSPLIRELLVFWAFILCIMIIANTMNSIWQFRFIRALYNLPVFLPCYLVLDVHNELYLNRSTLDAEPFAVYAGSLPVWNYLLTLAVLTVFVILLRANTIRYERSHITPHSIKEAADELSTGLCYYQDDSTPVLTNSRMNEISFEITGHELQNGNEFLEAVRGRDIVKLKGGEIIRFSHHELNIQNEKIHEFIAENITEFYLKTESLLENNERMRDQNQRLKDYSSIIDDVVRREEVLRAKARIHNEMNRLLLATDQAVLSEDEEKARKLLDTWQANILLLCMEADPESNNNALSDINELSRLLEIRLVFSREPQTLDSNALGLFTLAIKEAMINAVKHAAAKTLFVNMTETNEMLTAVFTNDGTPGPAAIREGGGLSVLRSILKRCGGNMKTEPGPEFRLTISIPIGGMYNVL